MLIKDSQVLDAYETFDDDVAASKELANLLTNRDRNSQRMKNLKLDCCRNKDAGDLV